jgi:hypothetical protein
MSEEIKNPGRIYYVAVREKNEEWFNGEDVSHDFICPKCGRNDDVGKVGDFVRTEDKLVARQFYTDHRITHSGDMKFAPYGICVGMCTWTSIDENENPYYESQGTPLVIDFDNFDIDSIPEINHKYWEDKRKLDGRFGDNEHLEFELPSANKIEGVMFEKTRAYFESAFSSGPLMLKPPYTVGAIGTGKGSGGNTIELLKQEKNTAKNQEKKASKANDLSEGYQLSGDDKKISSDEITETKDKMHWFRQLSPILTQFKVASSKSKGLIEDRDLKLKRETLEIQKERNNNLLPETEGWQKRNLEITVLEKEIKDIESSLENDGKMPKRKVEVLVAGYLHKTVKLEHIEPFWVFMKRTNMNRRTIENSMANWYPPNQVSQMMKLVTGLKGVVPSERTIESLVLSINDFCKDVELSNEESLSLKDEAINVMGILKKGILKGGTLQKSVEEGDESEYKLAFEDGYFIQDQFNFASEGVAHSPGFVEALCVMASAKRKLDSAKANDLIRYYLFPESQLQTSWWRAALSSGALETHKYIDNIVSELEK